MNIKRIKDLRVDNDIKQKEIADFLGCTQQQYSEYESNKRTISIDRLVLIADLYKVSVDYLLGRTDVSKPYPSPLVKRPTKGRTSIASTWFLV